MLKNILIKIKFYIYHYILRRKYLPARNWYLETDEKAKYIHILEAVNYLRVAQVPNVFFEFGCHSGRTFSSAILSSKFLDYNLDCYAFDSFEGLPETVTKEDGYFKTGTFYTSENDFKKIVFSKTGVKLKNSQIVKGFYNKTLNKSLKNSLPNKVGFVHIDVDLYSSTITVLDFIKRYLTVGTVILFDDWYCFSPGKEMGERKAFNEFLNKNQNFKVEEWKNYSTFGKSFIVNKT